MKLIKEENMYNNYTAALGQFNTKLWTEYVQLESKLIHNNFNNNRHNTQQ